MYPSEIVTERPQDQLPFNGITIIWPVTSSDTEYTSESGLDIVGWRGSSPTFHTWLPEDEETFSTQYKTQN